MKLKSVTISNYESIGSKDNIIDIDDKITTIIGKNESGKSNVLKAIKQFDFLKIPSIDEVIDSNRMKSEEKLELSCVLSDDKNKVKFTYKKGSFFDLDGSYLENIKKNKELSTYLNFIIEKTNDLEPSIKNSSNNIDLIKKLKAPIINTNSINDIKTGLNGLKNCFKDKDYFSKIEESVKNSCNILNNYLLILPKIYPVKLIEIKNQYTLNEIKDAKEDSFIYNLCKAIKITKNDLYKSCKAGGIHGDKSDIMDFIRDNLEELSEKFSNFYNGNKVNIKMEIYDNYFNLLVKTNNKSFNFSERSNGLKWYLNLFIQLEANNLFNGPVIILIDEPGGCLHIDAQQELLKLLEELANKMQIIYTTHSPFMINKNHVERLRLLENVEGITHIYNKLQSANLNETSKMETLSPFIKALGFSPMYNIGPKPNDMNIITEGISDYHYFIALMEYFKIKYENRPNIIASTGGGNCLDIAKILFGWNCKFKILFDNDHHGFQQINAVKHTLINPDSVFTVLGKKMNDVDQSKNVEIEDLFSKNDGAKFSLNKNNKIFSATRLLNLVNNNEIVLDSTTTANFNTLFTALGIL